MLVLIIILGACLLTMLTYLAYKQENMDIEEFEAFDDSFGELMKQTKLKINTRS